MKTLLLTPVAAAVLALLSTAVQARPVDSGDDPCDPPVHSYCPGYVSPAQRAAMANAIAGNADTPTIFNNLGIPVTVPALGRGPNGQPISTGGWIADFGNLIWDGLTRSFFGGGRDLGDFACTSCVITWTPHKNPDGTNASPPEEWSRFMYAVVNPILWPSLGPSGLNRGAWRPGDSIAVCNGTVCEILTWHAGGGTVGWWPDINPNKPAIKPDIKHKYKNDPNDQWNSSGGEVLYRGPTTSIPIGVGGRYVIGPNPNSPDAVIPTVSGDNLQGFPSAEGATPPPGTGDWAAPPIDPHMDITMDGVTYYDHGDAGYSTTPRDSGDAGYSASYGPGMGSGGGGGSGGGESCVHVDSRLPDGRRAGDIKVGDTIQLGEEGTLDTRVGVVTYSKPSMQRGYRITTQSGISLLCSDTAPICTDDGFVKAPELLGKKVAVRVDDAHNLVTRFELVEVVAEVGMLEVQHITVGDQAFWAGAEHGSYILHHNKTIVELF